MVSLYCFIFFEARLYSDALLQVFFFGVNVYGWRHWLAVGNAGRSMSVISPPAS